MGRALDHAYPALFEAQAYNNLVINGGMAVSQELGFSSPNTLTNNLAKYVPDQWLAGYNHAAATAVFTATAQPSGGPAYNGSYLELKATTLSAMAGASDYAIIEQPIEGYRIERLGYGILPKSVAVGFYVWATIAGTATASIRNSAQDRSYVANFTVNSPATWEYKTIVIPGDAVGTWLTTTGIGLFLSFCFGGGTTFNGTNNAWSAGNFIKTTSTTNFFASNNNKALISNVTMIPGGEVAPEQHAQFLQRPYAEELRLCQRYFWRSTAGYPAVFGSGFTGTAIVGMNVAFPVSMRITPTLAIIGTWATSNCGQPLAALAGPEGFTIYASATATGNVQSTCNGTTQYVTAGARM